MLERMLRSLDTQTRCLGILDSLRLRRFRGTIDRETPSLGQAGGNGIQAGDVLVASGEVSLLGLLVSPLLLLLLDLLIELLQLLRCEWFPLVADGGDGRTVGR